MPPREEGRWRLLNPLNIRFSQPRIAPHFRDGHLIKDTVTEILEAPVQDPAYAGVGSDDAAEGVPHYDAVLVPPFPAIRVISWLPKLRRPDGEVRPPSLCTWSSQGPRKSRHAVFLVSLDVPCFILHANLRRAIRLKSYRTVLFLAWLGAEGTSMVLAPLLVLFACLERVANAEELQLPQQVFEKQAEPAFLSLSNDGVDSCTTDNVCQEICETDFMVYPLGDKCYEYCHEDIHYIWDVFDKYCGEGLNDEHHFCADLCYDGFYCGDSTCGPCEDKCVEAFGLVHQIFDYCADCDDFGDDYDDDYYKTTTTTTTADRCNDLDCWCHDICDIVKCPHCEELCHKNQDKVWPIFERYCECGFCHEADREDAGLLQFRVHSAASSESTCGCRSEYQYCIDICHGIGYGRAF
ncbi:unnamed protein product [Symbiodinium sp. CCMP2456]|nr:unnamed protein product [Symbiodinium sp. CCMP2456]